MAASTAQRQTYLIQDPYDPYAIQFIRTIFTYFGLRPVCFHTDTKARYYGERAYPVLRTSLIERSVDADLANLSGMVEELTPDFEIVGVVPWGELHVAPAAELCHLLDLRWNQCEVLARFRDKNSLKDYVAKVAPDIRVPLHRLIRTADDLSDGHLPKRFVLKPNDGFGNMNIGIFDDRQLAAARRHIAAHPSITWILEEFIGGTEYHIDGQVREAGTVVSLAVFEYVRTEANGYETVYLDEIQCPTDDPLFGSLTDYADRLLTATGLRRCPFHLEVKVDEDGPCVVDLGARLPSDGGGPVLGRLHPYRPDPFAVAASDYLERELYPVDHVDWTHYDRERAVFAYGISSHTGLIETVEGVEQVEAMPEFVIWTIKPMVGERLEPTTDLRSTPFIAELSCAGSRADAIELAERVRNAVAINRDHASLTRIEAAGRNLKRRLKPKVRWMGRRVVDAVFSATR